MTEAHALSTGFAARIDQDPFLGWVVLAIAGLALCVTVSIVWLTARALWEARTARRRERCWREVGHPLAAVIGDPVAEAAWLVAARGHAPELLRHCLNEYLIRTSGELKDGIARLYRELGLLAFDLAGLRSRRWSVRMRALRRLAAVATSEHRQAIAALANEGGEVRLLVAQIIGRIGTAADVQALLASWSLTSRLSEYPLHVMLDSLAPSELRALLEHWPRLASPTLQRILLDAAAQAVPGACHRVLPEAACHPSLEVRIAAARACSTMTSPQTFELLTLLAADPEWEVRAQAVKALGVHPSAPALDLLAAALCDPSFWVRQNAASALGRQGPSGVGRLRYILAAGSDRFARDAAEHVLTDLGFAPPARPT